jgi:hypothetical protein
MGGPMRSNAKPTMAQPPEGFSFLCDKEVLEFKHMTAKEEDILTSKTLLKKGLAIDRVIKNVIIDKSIDPDSLLVGDRNALIIALRAASYGSEYQTNLTCPSCQAKVTYSFDLEQTNIYGGEEEKILRLWMLSPKMMEHSKPFFQQQK